MAERKRLGSIAKIKECESLLKTIAEKKLDLHDLRYAYVYAALNLNGLNINKTSKSLKISVRAVRQYMRDFEKMGIIEPFKVPSWRSFK